MCRLMCHCVRHIGLDNKHGRSVKAIHSFLSRWKACTELCAGTQKSRAARRARWGARTGACLPYHIGWHQPSTRVDTDGPLEHLHFSALARIRCCSSVFRAATEDDTLWLPHRRSASRGLYMIGGRGGDHRGEDYIGEATIPDFTDMERFRDGAWSLLPPWPLARRNTGAAPLDGCLYVIGGQLSAQGAAVRDVEVFDPLTNTRCRGLRSLVP